MSETSFSHEPDSLRLGAGAPAQRMPAHAGFWAMMGAITLASLLLRQDGASADVSWLTSMCKRILDGETGWVDIFETTPPVPTLLYMPGVLLSRLFGVSAEITVFATAYAAAIATLAFCARLLPERIEGSGPSRWVVIVPATVFLFMLSDGSFAQREYFAAAFSLPVYAVFVRRAQEGKWPPLSDRIIAALLAGLAFAIKPPLFALPFLALGAFEWARTRSLSFLFPSMLPLAAVSGVALTALSLALFPAYLDGVLTLMRDVYVPIRAHPNALLFNLAFFGTIFCLAASFILSVSLKSRYAIISASLFSAAFLAVAAIQGKYFSYHAQPAALFALIALAITLYSRGAGLANKRAPNVLAAFSFGALAIVAVVSMVIGFAGRGTLMRDLSWAEGMNRPTAMGVTPVISTSFPLAEQINARWVDRIHSQWVARYTRVMLGREGLSEAERTLFQRYYDFDLARTRAVIRERKPELIIQAAYPDALWLTEALLEADPSLLDDYEPIAENEYLRVLRRRSAQSSPTAAHALQ